ncbi:MAG: hypothetical protein ACREAN_01420, partial [Nitrosopumilaceae archaeon]
VNSPVMMMHAFSLAASKTIVRNVQFDLKIDTTSSARPLIAINNQAVISTREQSEAGKVFAILNSLPNQAIFSRLREMWNKAQSLIEHYKSINRELQKIRIFVHQGVRLKGACEAGIEAKYEKPIPA